MNQKQKIMNEHNEVLDNLMLSLMDKSEMSIYQILPKSYIVLNLNGKILGYNSRCRKLLGLMDNEEELKNIKNFLIGENKKKMETMLEFVRLKGSIDDFELEITRSDGQIKIIWISASTIYDSNKDAIAMHCLMSDMTKEQMFLNQVKEELHAVCH